MITLTKKCVSFYVFLLEYYLYWQPQNSNTAEIQFFQVCNIERKWRNFQCLFFHLLTESCRDSRAWRRSLLECRPSTAGRPSGGHSADLQRQRNKWW